MVRQFTVILSLMGALLLLGLSAQLQPISSADENKKKEQETCAKQYPLGTQSVGAATCYEASNAAQAQYKSRIASIFTAIWDWFCRLVSDPMNVMTAVIAFFTIGLYLIGKQTAKRQLRAYVALEDIYFMWKDEFLPLSKREFSDTQRIRVKNYGPTSASNLRIAVERTMSRERPMHMSVEVASYTLPPNQRFGRTLTETLAFRSTTDLFWTHGEVSYTDIYGRLWVSEFCFRYDGIGCFTPDTEHNRERGPYRAHPA